MPGPDPGGCIVTVLIGIAGAFIGGFLMRTLFGGTGSISLSLGSILVATLGAVILLAVYRAIIRRAA
ncbi:MAG: GlsB/YeaQ/YmgE family stress response membrane protein [Actinomycetota bacterium]|nr:GlsB/YeaQ/YmgE family stress response membrane protein [Actinomycetota bacterium]